MSGKLVLVPTPIDETNPLEGVAHALLLKAATDELENSIFVIEDLKPGRRRWLSWKLPREVVEDFVLFNEHTSEKLAPDLIKKLKSGHNIYLMSDGGLPAFCDPGQNLVKLCHEQNIKVTATPFQNSISLAIALSGIDHNKFLFAGFLPIKDPERALAMDEIVGNKITTVLMDTPYRLKKLLEELENKIDKKRNVFLAMDLNSENEELLFGPVKQIRSKLKEFKREFILVLAP
ncbi:tetrapyrrole methylase [Bacteriovorax sp. BSW11_IV]|uniref:SAM-dependent methyltransferase n=1 Tax=Bacteriovorax sp. BSW11_IV TaxID=1353529 RepID=UPI000389E357|nr:SAM-dependent methyltransferase [Bacteriovorax sp. BSW11_IV]EQC49327.1 tetrapyrrole methylase [Bacteriovorax sp. BSW11_IV]